MRSPVDPHGDMDKETAEAYQFFSSFRGYYIMSKALHTAIEALELVPGVRREVADIGDMKYLRDSLFSIYPEIVKAERETEAKLRAIREGDD